MNSIDELRQLAASMRHSAGTYMVPGYDGNKVANLIESALAYSAPKWQDIATAPKDTYVLLWVDVAIGLPLIVQGCWFKVSKREQGWIDTDGNVITATHWMPFPDKMNAMREALAALKGTP
jgi:hypothetical protein